MVDKGRFTITHHRLISKVSAHERQEQLRDTMAGEDAMAAAHHARATGTVEEDCKKQTDTVNVQKIKVASQIEVLQQRIMSKDKDFGE